MKYVMHEIYHQKKKRSPKYIMCSFFYDLGIKNPSRNQMDQFIVSKYRLGMKSEI